MSDGQIIETTSTPAERARLRAKYVWDDGDVEVVGGGDAEPPPKDLRK